MERRKVTRRMLIDLAYDVMGPHSRIEVRRPVDGGFKVIASDGHTRLMSDGSTRSSAYAEMQLQLFAYDDHIRDLKSDLTAALDKLRTLADSELLGSSRVAAALAELQLELSQV